MKKFFAFVLVMAMAVVASASTAPLAFTSVEDGDAMFGIEATNGLIGMAVKLVATGEVAIDYSTMDAAATFPGPFVKYGAPWSAFSGAPMYSDVNGNISCLTSLAPNQGEGQFGIVSAITALIDPSYYLSSSPEGAVGQIDMVAVDVNDGVNNIQSGVLDSIYVVPEPITMSLLGLGGLVVARRRRA